jgi:hypothetical protein
MKNNAPFKYIETKEPALLAQYFAQRRRVYLMEYPWLPLTFGAAEVTDHVSRVVLAMCGKMVAGGARLTMSTPFNPRRMPLEEAGFRLCDCDPLASLNLAKRAYGEISRMVVDPGMAHGFSGSFCLGDELCARAASEGTDTVFSICPERPARINAINAKRRGVGFHRFREVPTVFGKDMSLCAFTGLLRVYGKEERDAA